MVVDTGDRGESWADRGGRWIFGLGSLGIVLMVLGVTYDVIMRYVFRRPTVWAGAVTEDLLVLVAFVGAVCALELNRHVSVDLVYRHIPDRLRKYLDIATYFAMLGFMLILMYEGVVYTKEAYDAGWRQWSQIQEPAWITRVVIPAGSFLFILSLSRRIYRSLRSIGRSPGAVQRRQKVK